MKKLTNEEKWKQIENLDKNKIFGYYHLEEIKKEIAKGNETIQVLYYLLRKEINKHNGIIARKIIKLRNTPTID